MKKKASLLQEEDLQAQSELVEKLSMKLGEIEENFEELQEENATIKKQVYNTLSFISMCSSKHENSIQWNPSNLNTN